MSNMLKQYSSSLTATINRKGVLDIDTVKGCELGLEAYPNGGCYGLCYAAKIAKFYGYDFSKSITRNVCNKDKIEKIVSNHTLSWFRVGVMGDPCHNWDWTVEVCEWLGKFKTPVIVSKMWIQLNEWHINILKRVGVIINISISALDSGKEIKWRLEQFSKLKQLGLSVVLRIVSAKFNSTLFNNLYGEKKDALQRFLFSFSPVIDTPLRIPSTDTRVVEGNILTYSTADINCNHHISVNNSRTHIGTCINCPDSCGVKYYKKEGVL